MKELNLISLLVTLSVKVVRMEDMKTVITTKIHVKKTVCINLADQNKNVYILYIF